MSSSSSSFYASSTSSSFCSSPSISFFHRSTSPTHENLHGFVPLAPSVRFSIDRSRSPSSRSMAISPRGLGRAEAEQQFVDESIEEDVYVLADDAIRVVPV
ncbi:hypothetical protein U1Q18_004054 [Sarracenia purpurea var. burkii]